MKMIKKFFRQLSYLFQSSDDSFARHNQQYEEPNKLEKEKIIGQNYIKNNTINDPELKIFDLLATHSQIQIAVDIGSGTGWSSASLAPRLKKIYAIEPSKAGIDIAKNLYPKEKYPNIEWLEGMAENVITTLKLNGPTLFFTSCVFSHLRDQEVQKICQVINFVAPTGSAISLAECWGEKDWHQMMWHVRTKDWWQEQFPDWELTFHGPQVPETNYNKGIWGVKIK